MVNIFSPSGLMKYTILMEGDGRRDLLEQIRQRKKLKKVDTDKPAENNTQQNTDKSGDIEQTLKKAMFGRRRSIDDDPEDNPNDDRADNGDDEDWDTGDGDKAETEAQQEAETEAQQEAEAEAKAAQEKAEVGNPDLPPPSPDAGQGKGAVASAPGSIPPPLTPPNAGQGTGVATSNAGQEKGAVASAPGSILPPLTPPNAGQGTGAAAKPKKYLILTSSGGGGHISAAKAKEDEIKKNHPGAIVEIIDLMGLYEKAANKDKPWIPTIYIPGKGEVFSGKANTAKWNEAQKAGGMDAVRNLEGLVELQHIAESIQHRKVYKSLKKYLAENEVEEIFNTQALSTPAICKAIHEHNKKTGKKIKLTINVTEFLSDRAVHFLNSIAKLPKEYKELIVLNIPALPLTGPGETEEKFYKKWGLDDPVEVNVIEPPVREEFKNDHSGKFTYSETNGQKTTITKGDDDHLSFITLGSQGSETILKYVNSYIDQIDKDDTKGTKYLCITAGKPGSGSLHEKISQLIEERKDDIPGNVQILPLGMQKGQEMASMMQNCDVLVTRTGGMSSMEAKVTQKFAKNRQVYLHSEQTVEHPAGFPNTNRDAIYEGLISGAVKWEAGNAEYLMKNIKAQMANYQTIAFNASGTVQQQSLFELAYETYESSNSGLRIANKETIKNLIYSGSNPNLLLPGGSHLIDHCADFKTAKLLVKHGAKITEKVRKKFTPAEITNLENKEELFITEYKQRISPFHIALQKAVKKKEIGHIKGILYLHDDIKYHERIDGKKQNLLLYAVEKNKNEAVEALASTGYNKHQLDEALHIAVKVNNVDAARHLLQNGANPHRCGLLKNNLVPKFKKEPVIYHNMLKMFIREGVINPAKYELTLPTNISADSLMDITFEEDNKFGNTAVHIAIHRHNNKQIDDDKLKKVLIQNIGDINKKNIDGLRPIDLTKHQETRKILAAFGANPKSIKGVPTTKNELGELQRNYSAFQSLFEKNEKVIKQAFATTDNADDFAKKLSEKISFDYDKNTTEYTNIMNEFKETFNKLKDTKDELEQNNIIKSLVNSILKIFGADKLNKAVKEEAKNLPKNIRDDYLKL